MSENVVDLALKSRIVPPTPVTDFWFAQVDARLSRIEMMIRRLEWQILLIVCGTAALLLFEIVRMLAPNA